MDQRIYRKIAALRPAPTKERTAAVLLLLREGEQGPELLLERRALTLCRQPGEICLPGGGVEPGEEPEQAVLRECAEELGLTEVELLAHVESLRHSTGERVEVYAGRLRSLTGLKPQKDEVAEVFAVPLGWFHAQRQRTARLVLAPDEGRCSPELRPLLSHYGRESRSPLWLWEGEALWSTQNLPRSPRVIWGMTARIIDRFLNCLEL